VARPAAGAPGAPGAPLDETERLVKAAGAYIAVWDVDGRAACEARRPACEHMEEMLDRAARALMDARRTGAAILVFQTLLDPRYHLDNTDRARMAPYEIGLGYQAIGAYAEAATMFERFTEEREALDQAPPALEEAARLRLRLGQRDKAIADAALFQRLYARKHPERSSRITLAIAARDEQEEDFAASISLLTAAIPAIDRAAPLETRIEAHVRLGRALAAMGRAQGAAVEMSRVLVIARDRASAAAALKRRGKDEAKDAATEDAIAEARFFQAEQKREEVLKIKVAPYRGSGDRASVLAYLNNAARAFVVQKQFALQEAERAYLRVFGIELPPTTPPPPPPAPSPPGVIGLLNSGGGGDPNAPLALKDDPFSTGWSGSPPSIRWAIAAAARVGAMWGDFVREIRSMPIPRDLRSPEEIRGTYYQILDSMDELHKQHAKAAFKTCLRYSVESQRFDDFSRSCEAWLARNYSAEQHTVDELVSGPRWLHPGLVAEPAPAPARAAR
jgi:tetratricopeptide (TPR) repeat protein